MKQIIEIIPVSKDNAEAHKLIKYYVEKYERQGSLEKSEQITMHQEIRNIAIKYKNKKI